MSWAVMPGQSRVKHLSHTPVKILKNQQTFFIPQVPLLYCPVSISKGLDQNFLTGITMHQANTLASNPQYHTSPVRLRCRIRSKETFKNIYDVSPIISSLLSWLRAVPWQWLLQVLTSFSSMFQLCSTSTLGPWQDSYHLFPACSKLSMCCRTLWITLVGQLSSASHNNISLPFSGKKMLWKPWRTSVTTGVTWLTAW